MDLSHSGWSDIFFLGMDLPEMARVLNVSIDLAIHGSTARRRRSRRSKPICASSIEPVLRLASVDLDATAEISDLQEVFDFARDYLGLLKAAVIASGIVPPGMEGSGQPLRFGSGAIDRARGAGHRNRQPREQHSQGLAAGGFDQPAGVADLGLHARDGASRSR